LTSFLKSDVIYVIFRIKIKKTVRENSVFSRFFNKLQAEKLQTDFRLGKILIIQLFRTHSLFIIVIILSLLVNKNSIR